MFSKSTKYALKAVLYLGVNTNENKKIMAKDLAVSISVPHAYTAKLLQKLSKHGIISSTKGPKGGFYLNDANRKNHIMEIINIIDNEKKMTDCLLSLEECNADKPCPLHLVVNQTRSKFISNLKNKSIADLVTEINLGRAFLPI